MPRYIDVERFCREVCRCAGLENGCDKDKCPIWNAPAEDVVPVVHGEWNETKYPFCNVCPRCGMVIDRTCIKLNSGKLNLCPNCGAKMDRKVIKSMKRAGESAENATESLRNVIDAFENVDRCVCCGEIVPEGRQVCPGCETGGDSDG